MSTTCASCGHPLDGAFCSRCGEERLDPRKLTVWHFVTDTLVPEIVNLDGKIWRTLRLLLLRPGFLALEYAAGRRRPYVKPLRVFLTAVVVYALSTTGGSNFTFGWRNTDIKLSPVPAPLPREQSVENTLIKIDRFGILGGMYEAKFGPVESATADIRERFTGTLNAIATPLSFTSVVLLAFALYACFHRRRPLFVEHAVFSMHYFSFALLSYLPVAVGLKLGLMKSHFGIMVALVSAVTLWQFAYLAASLRRFYLPASTRVRAWPMAIALAVLIYVLNSFFITAVQFAAGAFAISRL